MPKIKFQNINRIIEITPGTSILEAAIEHKIPLFHTCGGNCSCSTCRVLVLKGAENLSKMEEDEAQILDQFDLPATGGSASGGKAGFRLGCQALVLKDEVEVEIPDRSKPPRANKTPPVTDDRHGTY